LQNGAAGFVYKKKKMIFKSLISKVGVIWERPMYLVALLKRILSNIFVSSSVLLLSAASVISIVVLGVALYDVGLLYNKLFEMVVPFFNSQLQKEQIVFPFWVMYLYFVSLIGVLISQKGRLWREVLPQIFELRYVFLSKLVFGCFILTCIGAEFRVLEILDSFFYFFFEAAVKAASVQSENFMHSDFSELPGGGMFLIAFAVKLLQLILLLTMHKRYGTLLLILCAPGLRFVFNGAPIVFPLLPFGEADGYVLESTFGGKKTTSASKPSSLVSQTTRHFCVGSNKNICWKAALGAVKEANSLDLREFNKSHASKGFSKNAAVDALGHGRNLIEKSRLPERMHHHVAKPGLTYDQFNLEHNSNKLDFSSLNPEEQVVAIIFYGNLAHIQSLTISSSSDVPIGDEYSDYARERVYNRETSRSPASIVNHVGNVATAQDEYIISQNISKAYPFLGDYSISIPEPGAKSDLIIEQEGKAPLFLDFKSKQGILIKENHTYYVDRISEEILKVTTPNDLRGGARVGVITQYTSYDPAFTPERLRELVFDRIGKRRVYAEYLLGKQYANLAELQRAGKPKEALDVVELEIRMLESCVAAAYTALSDPETIGFINRVDIPIIDAYGKPLPFKKLVELKDWAEKDAEVLYKERVKKNER
jgi:hypothetical protein